MSLTKEVIANIEFKNAKVIEVKKFNDSDHEVLHLEFKNPENKEVIVYVNDKKGKDLNPIIKRLKENKPAIINANCELDRYYFKTYKFVLNSYEI